MALAVKRMEQGLEKILKNKGQESSVQDEDRSYAVQRADPHKHDLNEKEQKKIGRRFVLIWMATLAITAGMQITGVSNWVTGPLFILLLLTAPDFESVKTLLFGNKENAKK